jgi:hypothetical protein
VKGKAQRLDVIFGPNYKVAVVWAPKPPAGQERNFICFEPMVGVTNAVNMAHKGTYSEFLSVALKEFSDRITTIKQLTGDEAEGIFVNF